MKQYYDAILIRPPEPIIDTWYDYAESLGIGYIASYARARGYKIKIIDAVVEKKDIESILEEIQTVNSNIIGFSVFQVAFENTVIISNTLRESGFKGHITLGGHFPTFSTESILKENKSINSIITYEGEIPFTQLIESIKNNISWKGINNIVYYEKGNLINNPINPLIVNLDTLPFPARDKFYDAFNVNKTISVSASRGCWNNCSFCTVTAFYNKPKGGRWRGRSVENIIEEVKLLKSKYSYSSFTFIDDNFFGPGENGRKRVIKFANELIRNKVGIDFSIECRVDDINFDIFQLLKRSGLKAVFLGLENGDNTVLKRYNKRATVEDNENAIRILESLDIGINAGFILFDPFITLEELNENIKFLKKHNIFDLPALLRKLELRNGMEYIKKLEDSSLLFGDNYDYKFSDPQTNKFYNLIQKCLANYIPSYFLFREIKNKKELSRNVENDFFIEMNASALNTFEDLLIAVSNDITITEKSKEFIYIYTKAKNKGLDLYNTLKFSSLIK